MTIEAVQFKGLDRPWHAVRTDDENQTRCGLNVIGAARMWQNWNEMFGRCLKCEAKEVTA